MNTSRKILFAVAAVGALGAASSAFAQATDTKSATASVVVINPIKLAVNTTPLSFGRVVLDGTANDATVTVGADGTLGTVAHATEVDATGTNAPSVPTFTVTGQANQAYTIAMAPTFTIGQTSGLLTVVNSLSTQGVSTLSSSGTDSFKVGGTLTIPQGTSANTYNGSVSVTVTYQ
jgi:hypothetical protein